MGVIAPPEDSRCATFRCCGAFGAKRYIDMRERQGAAVRGTEFALCNALLHFTYRHLLLCTTHFKPWIPN
jgi:hypothetical protein